ncbi:hypothetical protein JCM8208_007607 [Rhodotorula glutinis]
MSSYGTPRPTPRATRPTQPPLDGPSLLLATPVRRTPSALRPALFHPRSAALPSRTLTPSTTTTALAHARTPATAPRPSSSTTTTTTTTSHAHSNPFDALPAAAFDSFVSSLTSSIRSALAAPLPAELPSARRRRERDEHARERDEARSERERRARERQEEEDERDREREERDERAVRAEEDDEDEREDVFGEVKEVLAPAALSAPGAASDDDDLYADDDDDGEAVATEPIIQDFALSSSRSRSRSRSGTSSRSPSPSSAPAPLEMRQIPSSSSLVHPHHRHRHPHEPPQQRQPLFVPHSAGSASASSDHELPLERDEAGAEGEGEGEYGREGTYGLETAQSASPSRSPSPSSDGDMHAAPARAEHDDEDAASAQEQLGDADADAGDDLDLYADLDDADSNDDDQAPRDPFGRPVRYAHPDVVGYAEYEDDGGEEEEEEGELESAPGEEDLEVGAAPLGERAAAHSSEDDELPVRAATTTTTTTTTKSGTELLELDSSSDLEPEQAPAPPAEVPVVAQQRARRAVYGGEVGGEDEELEELGEQGDEGAQPVAVEQPHLVGADDLAVELEGATQEQEQEHEQEQQAAPLPFNADAAMLDALPPWLAAGVGLAPYGSSAGTGRATPLGGEVEDEDEEEEGGGASSAAWADVEDEGQDEVDELELELEGGVGVGVGGEAEGAQEQEQEGEWYGEGVPADEVEMGREDEGSGASADGGGTEGRNAEMVDGQGVGGAFIEQGDEEMLVDEAEHETATSRNPLEGVYADEDSEDLRPRIPYSAKGKARAPATPSDLSRAESRSLSASPSPSPSPSPSSTASSDSRTSFDLDAALADWAHRGAPTLPELAPSELLTMHDELVVQLQRAIEAGSEVGLLVLQQVKDVERVFEHVTGEALVLSDEEEEDKEEWEAGGYTAGGRQSDEEERGHVRAQSGDERSDEDGEVIVLPRSPLSARLSSSASPPPPSASRSHAAVDDDDDEPDTADRSAYFPDLERGADSDSAAHAAAEARLDEIAGELIEMREGGFVGELRVERSGMEELEEDEDEMVVVRGSSVVEVETDGETMLPSEVVSVRGTSVLSDRSLAYLDVQALDSSVAADSADEERARRSPESARPVELADAPVAPEPVAAAPCDVELGDGDDDEVLIVEEANVTETIDLAEQPAELERHESRTAAALGVDVPSSSATKADVEQPAHDEAPEPTRAEVESTPEATAVEPQQDALAATRDDTPLVVENDAPAVDTEPIEPIILEPVVAQPATSHASFAPSAPVDPAFDAPLAPSSADAASTGDPRVPLSTISAPHLSSHFRLEDRPPMSLSSPIPYPPVRAEHNVDSPVHSDDERVDLVDEAPVRVGVSDEEMRDAALVGRHVPLASMQDGSPVRAKKAYDLPAEEGEAEQAQGGLTIFDDDASFPPSRSGELESVAQALAAAPHAHAFIGATPPPIDGDEGKEQQPPIVDGVAPPQNLDIVPESAPPSPPRAHVEPPAPAPVELERARDASPAAVPEVPHASFAPSAPVDPSIDAGRAPTALDLAHSPSPAAPSPALSPRAFSSHFQLAPGPTPALDSPIPYPPVHAEHSVDSPVHSDDERVDLVDEAPVRVGIDDEEMRDEALAGKVRPLEEAVDASGAAGALEQVDVEMDGEEGIGASGLLVVDDDADGFGSVEVEEEPALVVDEAPTAPLKSLEQLDAEPSFLGTTRPSALDHGDERPPIVDGVAPPQNPSLLPDPLPASPPATLGDAFVLADTPVLPLAPSTAPADPQPADEVRFEDFITLDESADEDADSDGGDSDEDILSLLVPERKRLPSSSGDVAVGPVLGVPAGEEVVAGDLSTQTAEDEESSSPSSPVEASIEVGELPLARETVGETAVEPLEAGEDVDSGNFAAAEPRATSQAPSSEPISYRSEDDLGELAFLEPEQGDGLDEPANSDEDEDTLDTSLLIHGVVDPGEWDPSHPIQFGSAADEPADEEMEGEAEEIVVGRNLLDQQDGADDSPRDPAPPRSPARAKHTVSTLEATPRRTRSADLATPAAPVESSPARRSTRLSSVVHDSKATSTPSSSSSKPQTPAAKKRSRKDDAAAGPSSTAKRVRRSGQPNHSTASASDEDREVIVPSSSTQHASAPAARHHHHPAPVADDERSRSSDAPLTRSRCAYVRLKIRSADAPRSAPYLVQVPSCALTSSVAKETMRGFDIENLGPVQDSDDCDGIQLGGHGGADSYAADSLHEALVPHGDVLAALQRLVGPDLWHEGAVEVLPRGASSTGKGAKRRQ